MLRLFLLAALGLLPTLALAQPSAPAIAPVASEAFVVQRLTGPVAVDGRVDDAAWDAIAPLPLVTHWPDFGDAPSEPTEIRVAYDDEAIYVSCRCYAPPEAVFAASFQRDLYTLGTDYLNLSLDTYNDNRTSVAFQTTPTGSRTDATTAGDTGVNDATWNTFWDAEAAITDRGWFAEMRIPFSSLRFQPEDGRVVMGLSAWRYLGKKNEMDLFPAIPPEWGFWSFNRPSQFQKVVFEGVRARRPIYVTPYALGGLGQAFALNDAETAYARTDDAVTELGADLKMSLSDDLTLDLTLNTDFAQVEADDAQVNLTRFSLFFPEQRQFFLERANLFDFDLGGSNRLFYSRRIGLQDGEAVRLLGGGRLVGRAGAWDLGVIDLQTARRTLGDAVLPSENIGVVRARRQAFNAYSTVGGLVTSRLGDDGTYNVAYGLDGDVRLFGDTFAEVRWAQTFDGAIAEGAFLDAVRMRAAVESRAYVGVGYAATVERAGQAYRPDVGFERRDDFTAGSMRLWRGWGQRSGSAFARHRARVGGTTFLRNADGSVETVEAGLDWEGVFASAASVNARLDVTYDDLRAGFALSDDVDVPAGAYTFAAARVSYDTPGGQPLRAGVSAGGGTFYDGWRLTAGFSPTWVVSKHLTLSGSYELNRIAFPERYQTFTAHVGRARVRAALDTRWSLATFVQLNSAAGLGLANLRLRYNPQEGSDLYLVVDWGFNTDRARALPGAPFTSQRTVLAKYTYTFAL